MSIHSVSLQIRKESDLFNPLDPDRMLLADEIKEYLCEKVRERNPGEKVELHIISEEAVDEKHVYEAVHQWCEKELMIIHREGRRNNLVQLWRLFLGLAFISVSIFLQNRISLIWYTVLSTIGAFSIWESASIWIVQNPKLKIRKMILKKLKESGSIIFERSTGF